MTALKGGTPKLRGKANIGVGAASAALAVGMLFNASPAQAASVIDLPGQGTNTIQLNGGGDVFQPQFALWPLPPNVSNNKTVGNSADQRGNLQSTGQSWLLGFGSGNVVQLATGGNIINPQFAVGTDNNGNNTAFGNSATRNGQQSTSVTGGQVLGHVIDGNGNIFQLEFLQGNIINPQLAILGDNNGNEYTEGNYAADNGVASNSTTNGGALAFIDGNGNVVQVVILSHNVIAPQVAVGGSNDLTVFAGSNKAINNGSWATSTTTGQQNPFAGILSITKVGDGNVTQIAILSNNVWAPQIALPALFRPSGTNTGEITTVTNDAESNGEGATATADITTTPHPGLDALRSTLDTVTGTTNHPVLDAIQKPLDTVSGQFGVGNINQDARGSGIIDNLQFSGGAVVAPINNDPPQVRTSFFAQPAILAGDSGGSNKSVSSGTTGSGNWKPGDGIKKVTAGLQKAADNIKNALTPKKPAE